MEYTWETIKVLIIIQKLRQQLHQVTEGNLMANDFFKVLQFKENKKRKKKKLRMYKGRKGREGEGMGFLCQILSFKNQSESESSQGQQSLSSTHHFCFNLNFNSMRRKKPKLNTHTQFYKSQSAGSTSKPPDD